MSLVNMKLTPEEAKEESGCCSPSSDGDPAYPYGLSVNLCDEVLQKLGITTLPTVGTTLMLTARVEVTNTSQYENQDGKEININLQITDMELSAAVEKTREQKMYPNSLMS